MATVLLISTWLCNVLKTSNISSIDRGRRSLRRWGRGKDPLGTYKWCFSYNVMEPLRSSTLRNPPPCLRIRRKDPTSHSLYATSENYQFREILHPPAALIFGSSSGVPCKSPSDSSATLVTRDLLAYKGALNSWCSFTIEGKGENVKESRRMFQVSMAESIQ